MRWQVKRLKPRSRSESESEQGVSAVIAESVGVDPKPRDLPMARLKSRVIAAWRTEPVSVEDGSDELWVAVKCQSNPEIAGSPRNAFRCSVRVFRAGGRALDGLGALPGYRSQPNSECRYVKAVAVRLWGISFIVERETAQTHPLRSLNPAKCERMWEHVDSQDVGLEAATIERVRNSLLAECDPAPIM